MICWIAKNKEPIVKLSWKAIWNLIEAKPKWSQKNTTSQKVGLMVRVGGMVGGMVGVGWYNSLYCVLQSVTFTWA